MTFAAPAQPATHPEIDPTAEDGYEIDETVVEDRCATIADWERQLRPEDEAALASPDISGAEVVRHTKALGEELLQTIQTVVAQEAAGHEVSDATYDSLATLYEEFSALYQHLESILTASTQAVPTTAEEVAHIPIIDARTVVAAVAPEEAPATDPSLDTADKTDVAEVTASWPRALARHLHALESSFYEQTVGFGYREEFPRGHTLEFIADLSIEEMATLNDLPIRQLRATLASVGVKAETFKRWVQEIDAMVLELGGAVPLATPVREVFVQWYEGGEYVD